VKREARAGGSPAAPTAQAAPELPEVRLADLGGVEIAYNVLPGDVERRPLLLLHGLTGHRDDFLPQLPALAARHPGLPLLAPDLRGHGDSQHAGDASAYTFEILVRDLGRFLDHRAIARCHLLAHSFGGMVALRFALAHPERVASLVLVGTAPFAPQGFDEALFERGFAFAREHGMVALQAKIELATRSRPPSRPSDRQVARWHEAYWAHHRRRFRCLDPFAYHALGLAMVGQVPVSDRLAELALPTTVITGVDDESFLAGADHLAAGIPGAVRIDIPDAGHHPHRENTTAWLDAVSGHLARTAGLR
jgi:pimeloyl-ACP methyl ester carboxylesterase